MPSIKPAFKDAFLFWLKLGFISFGGPAGQIAIMHQFLVEKKKWISESRFLHALNYCMLLPGPEAQQLATYTGWLLHGIRGGLVAGIFFILPSVFVMLILSIVYVTTGNLPVVSAIFAGLKPAVLAIVIQAVVKISKKSLKGNLHYGIAALSFVCIYFLKISFPLIIIGAMLLGIIYSRIFRSQIKSLVADKKESSEDDYYINTHTVLSHTGFKIKSFLRQIGTGLILWLIPVGLFYFFTSDFLFWKKLILFFTNAAFVTFGGAYAVLPYVAQVSVEKFNWLNQPQMIDGLALGETTPGPLIMVLGFVGFMGGFNNFSAALLPAALALIITTFYTFLPSFVFIFAGAPIIEKTHQNEKLKFILNIVSAAVVGVIINLAFYFGKVILFKGSFNILYLNWVNLVMTILYLILLQKLKWNMLLVIAASGVFGLARFYFGF